MEKKNNCLIPKTHKRFNQALLCLDEAIKTYQEPDRFISNINNLIQTLRSITWVLQKEHRNIKGFKEWYGDPDNADNPKENTKIYEMKNDDVMKWLVSARNQIVKQGDLETKSLATVYIKTYERKQILQFSFNPFSKIEDIARDIINKHVVNIPAEHQEEVILTVERLWVIDDFPKAEILDLLIYCIYILLKLLEEAHEKAGCDFIKCEHNSLSIDEITKFLLVHHNRIETQQTINLKYSDCSRLACHSIRMGKEEMERIGAPKECAKRYGDIKKIISKKKIIEKEYPFSEINKHIELVKHLLKKDKYLLSVSFVYTNKDNPPLMMSTQFTEKVDKYLFFEKLAKTVEEHNAIGVMTINEAWLGSLKECKKYNKKISDLPEKQEVIMMSMATPHKTKSYIIPFTRQKSGEIKFGKLSITEKEQPYFTPIYQVWKEIEKLNETK